MCCVVVLFSSRRRHTRSLCDWSSDVCSSDLAAPATSAATPPVVSPKAEPKIGAGPGPVWQTLRTTVPAVTGMLGGSAGLVVGGAAGALTGNPYLAATGAFLGGTSGAGAGTGLGEAFLIGLETLGRKLGLGEGLQPVTRQGALNRISGATNTGMVAE